MDHKPRRKMMTIYNRPGIINMSLNFTPTPANIKAGCLATEIFPYNRDMFVNEKFLSSSRPAPATDTAASSSSNANIKPDESAGQDPTRIHFPEAGPSERTHVKTNLSSSMSLTPELVRPFPKSKRY
jgi:hypothetical protein